MCRILPKPSLRGCWNRITLCKSKLFHMKFGKWWNVLLSIINTQRNTCTAANSAAGQCQSCDRLDLQDHIFFVETFWPQSESHVELFVSGSFCSSLWVGGGRLQNALIRMSRYSQTSGSWRLHPCPLLIYLPSNYPLYLTPLLFYSKLH